MRMNGTMHLCILLCLLAAAPAQARTLSGGVTREHIGVYSVERLNRILTEEKARFSSFPVEFAPARNAVDLYRVTYPTVIPELGDRPTTASGLVAVPRTFRRTLPVVSYQHGTVFSRSEVPSNPEQSYETRLAVARFAGDGYVVVCADYLGKGVSGEPDAYLVRDATVRACADMLAASRAVCADLGIRQGALLLSGWSQGAWNTMALRRALEAADIPVRAAATASTPSDLFTLLARWINNPTNLDAPYLVGLPALFLHSYEHYYSMAGLAEEAIRPPYRQAARDLFENRIGWEEAARVFPGTIREFLEPDFMESFSRGESPLARRFQENQALRWRYLTPGLVYYGGVDEVVAPPLAKAPAEYAALVGGAGTAAVHAGDQADHRGTFLFGMRDQKDWFDALLGRKAAR